MGKKTDTLKKAAAPAEPAAVAEAPAAKPAKRTVRKAAAPKAAKTAAPKISGDDIALRAYFIAEKRQQHGLPGNSETDWLEAERQLLSELSAKKKIPKKPAAKASGISSPK
jgi:hypothetical protein